MDTHMPLQEVDVNVNVNRITCHLIKVPAKRHAEECPGGVHGEKENFRVYLLILEFLFEMLWVKLLVPPKLNVILVKFRRMQVGPKQRNNKGTFQRKFFHYIILDYTCIHWQKENIRWELQVLLDEKVPQQLKACAALVLHSLINS